MERDRESLEDILPESSTQLVSLNTRVPRFVSEMIDQSVGILQLTSPYLKFTKQSAVQVMLERGFASLLAEFESMDNAESEVAVSSPVVVEIEEIRTENITRDERETKAQQAYDMKAYAEFANKSSYTPRQNHANRANSEIATKLQTKLGLR
jgi:hypothetical protein